MAARKTRVGRPAPGTTLDEPTIHEDRPTSSLAAFLAHKEAIQAELEAAFLAAIEQLGSDVKGVDWFSSTADSFCARSEGAVQHRLLPGRSSEIRGVLHVPLVEVEEVILKQIVSCNWSQDEGGMQWTMVGLGEDGRVYRYDNTQRGWIPWPMTVLEYQGKR